AFSTAPMSRPTAGRTLFLTEQWQALREKLRDWKPSKSSLREPQLRIMIFIIPYMLRPLVGWDGPRTENRQALPGMLNVWRPLRSSWFQKAERLLELQRTLIWKMRKKLSRLHLWNTALM